MRIVTISYDNKNRTYDAFLGMECVFYGTADELGQWLMFEGYTMLDSPLRWSKRNGL